MSPALILVIFCGPLVMASRANNVTAVNPNVWYQGHLEAGEMAVFVFPVPFGQTPWINYQSAGGTLFIIKEHSAPQNMNDGIVYHSDSYSSTPGYGPLMVMSRSSLPCPGLAEKPSNFYVGVINPWHRTGYKFSMDSSTVSPLSRGMAFATSIEGVQGFLLQADPSLHGQQMKIKFAAQSNQPDKFGAVNAGITLTRVNQCVNDNRQNPTSWRLYAPILDIELNDQTPIQPHEAFYITVEAHTNVYSTDSDPNGGDVWCQDGSCTVQSAMGFCLSLCTDSSDQVQCDYCEEFLNAWNVNPEQPEMNSLDWIDDIPNWVILSVICCSGILLIVTLIQCVCCGPRCCRGCRCCRCCCRSQDDREHNEMFLPKSAEPSSVREQLGNDCEQAPVSFGVAFRGGAS